MKKSLLLVLALTMGGGGYLWQRPVATPLSADTQAQEAFDHLPAVASGRVGPHAANHPHAALDASQLTRVALQHQVAGRHSEALQTLADAIARFPAEPQLLAVRASLYVEAGQAALALQDLQQALRLAPEDALLLTSRAQVYRQFGQIEAALADLDRAIALAPQLLAAHFNRGAIRFDRQQTQKALEDFAQCIAIDPHAAAPYFNRASVRHSLGDLAGAEADLQRFLELSENSEWNATARRLLQQWTAGKGAADSVASAS